MSRRLTGAPAGKEYLDCCALFRKALKDVLVVYPDAKVDADSSKALILQPSRTSVRKLA